MSEPRGPLSQQQKAARRAARRERLDHSSWMWAQAVFRLEQGDFDAASVAGLKAFASARPRDSSHRGAMVVYGCADLPVEWMFLDPGQEVAVVSLLVWRRHCNNLELYALANTGLGLDGPGWARVDVEELDLARDLDLMRTGDDTYFYGRPLT